MGRRRKGNPYTTNTEKKDRPDSPRWPSRRLTQGPTPALCFASDSNLSLSPVVHCAHSESLLPRVAISHPTVLSPRLFARSLALPSGRTWRSSDGRAAYIHRIRWVDAYESPGAARARVRFSCMLVRARARARRVDALTHINP